MLRINLSMALTNLLKQTRKVSGKNEGQAQQSLDCTLKHHRLASCHSSQPGTNI